MAPRAWSGRERRAREECVEHYSTASFAEWEDERNAPYRHLRLVFAGIGTVGIVGSVLFDGISVVGPLLCEGVAYAAHRKIIYNYDHA